MALIDDLKKQLKEKRDLVADLETDIQDARENLERLIAAVADLDRAIAALEPTAEATPEPEPEPQIPEGFTKWEGGDCPVDPYAVVEIMHPNGKRHFGSPENVWWQWRNSSASDGIIAYRVLQPAPVPDEQDDASEFAEEGYAPVVEAEPLADPIWNEPEPAQATTLEADALAKALDYYDPKAMAERDRFNPFNIFRKEGDQ